MHVAQLLLLVLAAASLLATRTAAAVAVANPAALQRISLLLTSVGRADTTQQPFTQPLLARLHPATPLADGSGVSVRSLDITAAPLPANFSSLGDGVLNELADFLASDATALALLEAAADDEALAELLEEPPFNRTERCHGYSGLQSSIPEEASGWLCSWAMSVPHCLNAAPLPCPTCHSIQVINCFCDDTLPWPHCDALLHQWLSAAWRTAIAATRAARAQTRRLHQVPYVNCNGVTSLFNLLNSGSTCVDAYCEAGVTSLGKIYGQVEVSNTCWLVAVTPSASVSSFYPSVLVPLRRRAVPHLYPWHPTTPRARPMTKQQRSAHPVNVAQSR